jgi:nucleotide-binding universal stress UspA family protein
MKIVVGVDGSGNSLAALKFAGRLLAPERDTIILYYSVPTAALEALRPQATDIYTRARNAFADAVFRKAKEALPAEFRENCVLVHDKQKPYKGLLTTANAHGAELLVVGARGTGPIQRLVLGSVSRSVAHACELPTLIVRNSPAGPAESPLRVLIACPGKDAGSDITSVLHKLIWPAGSEAKVIHVIESLFAGEIPGWLVKQARSSEVELQAQAWVLQHEQDKKEAEAQVQEYCQGLPSGLTRAGTIVAEGNPSQQILDLLETEKFDLTVLGTHGLGPVMRLLLGSTSEHVLDHAPTSVLIVPRHDDHS